MVPALRVAEREWFFFKNTWRGQAFTSFIAPVLLLIALGVGLGGLVSDDASIPGDDYLTFIVPGLMVGAVVQNASGLSLWPIMAGHRWLGFHRAMVSTPISPTDVVSGYLLFLAGRALVTGSVFLLAGWALGGVPSPSAILALPVAAATAAAFAAPLMAYTARVESDLMFDPIMRLFVTPLYLFSGTIFPSSELPAGVEFIAQLFPLWHGVDLARQATTGSFDAGSALVSVVVIGIWIGVGTWWARRSFTDRLGS